MNNKLLPILLVVIFSGCSKIAIQTKYDNLQGANSIDDLLKIRNQCSQELGGIANYSCSEFYQCMKLKGWDSIRYDGFGNVFHSTLNHGSSKKDFDGILVPPAYATRCDWKL